MRLAYYAGASTAAAAACLLKAFHQRPNFYSATVYLSQSNACLLILTNLLLVLACSVMYGLQRLLYGPLRPIEIEQLSEKAWYAVLDTLLAMPSFREDVGGWLLAMFTLLLAGKVWGWIGEGRVDILEQQPPANPRLFHVRLATSLVLSIVFNLWMLDYCVQTVMADPRPGMMVIFTFEFAILTIFSSFTFARYLLTCIQTRVEKVQMQKAIEERKTEIRAERAAARQTEVADANATPAPPPAEEPIEVDENEVDVPGWEEKRRYLFALEVFTDFIKLLIYVVFFTVSITFNGLPMHIMRDVFMTFASFSKRVADYVAYRKATSDMNARYPDATTEEIRGDACIVCREIMTAWEQPAQEQQQQGQAQPAGQQPAPTPAPARRKDEGLRAKKLPCGHILHLRCLKSWLERQQVCPTCRRPVISATDANTRGQQVAAGAGQGGQGAQGRQAGQRQGRARILNFGPVRIGFLNGPGDQINNIVRQMQNPGQQNAQAAAAGNAAPQDAANQQGPNHLGLQVPYASNGQQGASTSAPTATVPTQVQIQQIERRIMNEAQGLGIEQQQLATLRAMEGELARLRAWHNYSRQGTAGAIPGPPNIGFPQPHFHHIPGATMPWQMGHPLPFPPPHHQPPQVLHGAPPQHFENGHQSLPEGMTLPEGWTVMPLQPADGRQQVNAQRAPADGQSSLVPNGAQTTPTPTYPTNAPGPESVEAQRRTSEGANGPTDDRGSPLFVPTSPPPTAESNAAATNGVNSSSDSLPPTATDPQASSVQAPADNRPPWNSEGWSFVDRPNGQLQPTTNGEHASTTSSAAAAKDDSANGGPPELSDQGYEGKGKGKAAEVEDVPDEGT